MNTKKVISILSNGVHIPPSICQMTFKAFNGTFEEAIRQPGVTYEQAYEQVERGHEVLFGRRRYASYESFRRVRGRHINKK